MKKRASQTELYWKEKIQEWKRSGLSQADYCRKQGLSASAFSKWKKKLHPKLKSKVYKPKNKYFKYTNLSNNKIEMLIREFLLGTRSVKQVSARTGVHTNTIYKIYSELRAALVNGAIYHPQLFFGSGSLLLLGPPNNLASILQAMKENYVGHSVTNNAGEIRSLKRDGKKNRPARMKTNIQVISIVLLYFSYHTWTSGEVFLYSEIGYSLFYRFVYAPEYDLDPNGWDKKISGELLRTIPATTVARANWDYSLYQNDMKELLDGWWWYAILKDREFRSSYVNKDWIEQMTRDLCWFLRVNRVGEANKKRNSYWDEFSPSLADKNEAYKSLVEKYNLYKPQS